MADVNKSIEISYRADIKQLLQNLKQMPNVTEKQAKDMVKGLQKQLRQAEKAAQKASTGTANSFKRIDHAAKKTTVNARRLRREFANIDRLTSEASEGLRLISPTLGDAAAQASVAASGVESLGRAMMVANPLFIAGAVVVGALIAAFTASAKQAEALQKSEERLNATLQESIKEFENLQSATDNSNQGFGNLIASTNDMRNELLLMQGQITSLELESLKNLQDIFNFEQQLLKNADTRLQIENDSLNNVNKRRMAIKEEIKLLEESRSFFSFNVDINKKQAALKKESLNLFLQERDIESEIKQLKITQQEEIRRAVMEREKVIEALQAEKEQQEAIEKAERRRKEAAAMAAEKEKERLAVLKQQEQVFNKINGNIKTSEEVQEKTKTELLDLIAKQDGAESELLRKMNKETDAINDQIHAANERLFIAKLRAETDEQQIAAAELEKQTIIEIEALEVLRHEKRRSMQKELADLKEENAKKEQEQQTKLHNNNLKDVQSIFNAQIDIANALQKTHEEDSLAARMQAHRLFRVNQAAALANIGFSIAEGLAKAAGQPIRTAAVVAAGIAATAKVFAQKPPTADMGMIGNNDPLRPDETTTRVLRGEAVIDRATVQSLGGEQGVRRLQEGSINNNVVVIQPFKHFDRFIKQAANFNVTTTAQPVKY